jgi:hypothetical protein
MAALRRSPLRDVIYGVRSIMPLILALSLLILLVLRRGLPPVRWEVEASSTDDDASSVADTDDASVHSRGALTRASMAMVGAALGSSKAAGDKGLARASMAMAAAAGLGKESTSDGWEGESDVEGSCPDTPASPPPPSKPSRRDDTAHGSEPATSEGKHAESAGAEADPEACMGGPAAPAKQGALRRFWAGYGSFIISVAVCQAGMIIFNIGRWDL